MKLELPKHSVYNEMAILGCFLIDGELFKIKRELLKEEFFYSSVCTTIYRAIKKLDKS
jgi:replicative DNA helicase